MAFCPNCGAVVSDNTASCPLCSFPIYNAKASTRPSPQASAAPKSAAPAASARPKPAPPVSTPRAYTPPVNTPPVFTPVPPQNGHPWLAKDISTARTFGILALVFAVLCLPLSIVFGSIGFSKAKTAILNAERFNDLQLRAEAEQAKKYNIYGFIAAAAVIVLATIAYIFFLFIAVLATSSSSQPFL